MSTIEAGLLSRGALPGRYQLARAGRLYVASAGTATMQAPVTAVPTTTAAWALYNGNTEASNLHLAILGVSYWLASGTPTLGAQLLAGVSPTVQASAPSAATNAVVASASANTRTTAAVLTAGLTLAGTPAWMSLGGTLQTAAAAAGQGIYADVDGALFVPPGFAAGFTVLNAGAGTSPLYGVSILYAELEDTLQSYLG